jgi:hypothetical protein
MVQMAYFILQLASNKPTFKYLTNTIPVVSVGRIVSPSSLFAGKAFLMQMRQNE